MDGGQLQWRQPRGGGRAARLEPYRCRRPRFQHRCAATQSCPCMRSHVRVLGFPAAPNLPCMAEIVHAGLCCNVHVCTTAGHPRGVQRVEAPPIALCPCCAVRIPLWPREQGSDVVCQAPQRGLHACMHACMHTRHGPCSEPMPAECRPVGRTADGSITVRLLDPVSEVFGILPATAAGSSSLFGLSP